LEHKAPPPPTKNDQLGPVAPTNFKYVLS